MNNESILKFFAGLIEKELGIVYAEANYFQLEHRLKEAAIHLGYKDLLDFFNAASSGLSTSAKSYILDSATNNETSFFRDVAIFKALSGYIVPELMQIPNKREISIWSVASSSGQEIYSIAIELDKLRQKSATFPDISIFASDVSDRILQRAKDATYSQIEMNRGLDGIIVDHYFDKLEDGRFRVKPYLTNNIRFKNLNLLHPWGDIGEFDIIFCRNVLIYQNVPNKIQVINELHRRLRPGGFLILGAAESLLGLSEGFSQINFDKAVFYKKIG